MFSPFWLLSSEKHHRASRVINTGCLSDDPVFIRNGREGVPISGLPPPVWAQSNSGLLTVLEVPPFSVLVLTLVLRSEKWRQSGVTSSSCFLWFWASSTPIWSSLWSKKKGLALHAPPEMRVWCITTHHCLTFLTQFIDSCDYINHILMEGGQRSQSNLQPPWKPWARQVIEPTGRIRAL